MFEEVFAFAHAHFGEALLPDFAVEAEFFSGTKRESSFDELDGFLNGQVTRDCHQNVNVVWHHDEIVNGQCAFRRVISEDIDEEGCQRRVLKQ